MREILFRGKRIDNGDWIYGFHVADGDGFYIINDIDTDLTPIGEWYKVNPDTVGQYTGIEDEKGMKIFEGDIIQEDEFAYQVVWDNDSCGWSLCVLGYDIGVGGAASSLSEVLFPEVIENIHDNPNYWRTA